MAKDPREQQETDAQRIPDTGTGKIDQDVPTSAPPVGAETASEAATPLPGAEEARQKLLAAREAVIAQLRRLTGTPEAEDTAPRGATESVLDVGDVAEASVRTDIAFATRQRLVERINRLTRALERVHRGTWGRCTVCGAEIERERLATVPEAETHRACEERLERGTATGESEEVSAA